jgi:hypothetical protein
VVECLPRRLKTLSSNPSTVKIQNKQTKKHGVPLSSEAKEKVIEMAMFVLSYLKSYLLML